MPSKTKSSTKRTPRRPARAAATSAKESDVREVYWRVARLERQVKVLSELIRDHAEDADRLVKIVGEDHEALRRQLLSEHQETILRRKHLRNEPPSSRNSGGRARLVP